VACCAAVDVTTYRSPIVALIDGELLPSADDQTYFGGVCGGSTRTIRYRLSDRAAVADVVVHAPEGEIADAVDYVDGDWSASHNGGSTFQVSFSPAVARDYRESAATILVLDADGHTLFMFGVGGKLRAPQLAIETFAGEDVTEVDLSDGNSHSFKVINYGFCNMGDILAFDDDGFLYKNIVYTYAETSSGTFVTMSAPPSLPRTEGILTLYDASFNSPFEVLVKVGPAPAAPTPAATCTDYMLADGSGVWHDTYGAAQGGCDTFYTSDANCAKYGDTAKNEGWVANDACCACGGGVQAGQTQPTGPVQCYDHMLSSGLDWHDSYGVENGRCFDWYDLGATERCSKNDAMYGYSSYDACCSCGGGTDGAAFEIQVEVCEDKTLSDGSPWSDSYAQGTWSCEQYASATSGCEKYGDTSPTEGMTANDACCICGGGDKN